MSRSAISSAFGGLCRRLAGKPWQGLEVQLPHRRLGTEYGGYAVLLGEVKPGSIVYSFGLGEDISFDLALIELSACEVFGFDPTPRSVAWVRAQSVPASFHVRELGVADYDGTASFVPPRDPRHISHTMLGGSSDAASGRVEFQVRRLTTLMTEMGHDRLDLLKMDVEGAEYAVLDDLLRERLRPRQILIEFHHGMHGIGVGRTEASLRSLQSVGYRIFDAQATGREFSLVFNEGI